MVEVVLYVLWVWLVEVAGVAPWLARLILGWLG
jgi:hypothetical protein